MKKKLQILITIAILLSIGCNDKNRIDESWNEIQNKSDFNLFFQYAIKSNNQELLINCIDSLEKHKPKEYCEILQYYNFYDDYADSTVYKNFSIENLCDENIDYYMNDLFVIKIDKNDSVQTSYLDKDLPNYKKSLISFYDTTAISFDLPYADSIEYNNKKYLRRRIAIFIYNEMRPDTIQNKTSWNKLILVTKGVLNTIENVKNRKSQKINCLSVIMPVV